MKRISVILLTALFLLFYSAADAQFNISIPKIPKVKKETTAPDQSSPIPKSPAAAASTPSPPASKAPAVTETSIRLDNIWFRANTTTYWPTSSKRTMVWLPEISFEVNGPVASGSQIYVDFSYPGSPKWLTCDVDSKIINAGQWYTRGCDLRNFAEKDGITHTGFVTFSIKMRNELAGTDKTLFTGTAKAGKAKPNSIEGPNDYIYYIDHDWHLPIGYISLDPGEESSGANRLSLVVAFWMRGDSNQLDPHLFYQGKEVALEDYKSCDQEISIETSQNVAETVQPKPHWTRTNCRFGSTFSSETNNKFDITKNPGEYEFKLLRKGRLARSIKFTVKPGGSIDNGIATTNKLNTYRTIVPVTILGDQDGTYDKTAWKAGAFWGHPLTGFPMN